MSETCHKCLSRMKGRHRGCALVCKTAERKTATARVRGMSVDLGRITHASCRSGAEATKRDIVHSTRQCVTSLSVMSALIKPEIVIMRMCGDIRNGPLWFLKARGFQLISTDFHPIFQWFLVDFSVSRGFYNCTLPKNEFPLLSGTVVMPIILSPAAGLSECARRSRVGLVVYSERNKAARTISFSLIFPLISNWISDKRIYEISTRFGPLVWRWLQQEVNALIEAGRRPSDQLPS